ncbi:hypothetical protein A1Q2_07820 [Trichosporon asahii var. asahii CBS 8904]|uniref:Bola-like protein n=2 Tax=Trichosporon asahii var. asahii TaxID=189963 RepID=K1VM65_TRIAC|nr:hypothetical protein A1Q1_01746 [Trichosporon asahii var. asahii CBS 2479]EJT49097.1 hypothetical protein A1Q1_01746 [Trichosporon asahii var. asahii CBS 2479]EKC97817.1 hypothetical protein A1Q2_07820 [Trichosporon asahii var. asahii CBS 8904]
MTVTPQQIEDKLRAAIQVDHLEIIDTSGNCGGAYNVVIVSPDFQKKMTLARHKMVNQILAEEIANVHAFSQKTLTPEQWAKEQAK